MIICQFKPSRNHRYLLIITESKIDSDSNSFVLQLKDFQRFRKRRYRQLLISIPKSKESLILTPPKPCRNLDIFFYVISLAQIKRFIKNYIMNAMHSLKIFWPLESWTLKTVSIRKYDAIEYVLPSFINIVFNSLRYQFFYIFISMRSKTTFYLQSNFFIHFRFCNQVLGMQIWRWSKMCRSIRQQYRAHHRLPPRKRIRAFTRC